MSWKSVLGSLACALLVAGCAALANVAPPVTPAMIAASGGASAAALETGRRIYATQCTACHSAEPVTKHSAAAWGRIVADMSERAKLDEAQESALLAYLRAVPKVAAGSPAS